MSEITIRIALESDAATLAELTDGLGYPTSADEMAARLRALPSSYRTLVAEIDGQVAGFIGLCLLPIYESSQPIGYILALSVSARFQRRGVGHALIDAAEKWFRDQGILDLRVSSGLQRTEAHLFYERCGFQKTGFRMRKLL